MIRFKPILAGLVTAALVTLGTANVHAAVSCNNDGNVQEGEDCDNGPNIIADGCDDNCEVLTGWACVDPGGSSPSDCHLIQCGDGITDPGECEEGECCNEDCTFVQAETVCRAAAGACDAIEYCTGSTATCPDDGKSTEVCRPAVSPECDVEEICDGVSDDCGPDILANACDDLDGLACTESTCTESGECVHADTCVEICRGPGYWQNHSGEEKGDAPNVGQQVIDALGGAVVVCGNIITETSDIGGLDSALEGLCVRTQGVEERQLNRQLVTARFNCAVSEGADCDQITGRFIDVSYSDCDALCEGVPVVDGPTVDECIDQLACFNKGGRIIEGACIIGTCNDDGTTNCGSDDDCADEIECVRFEDSCANGQLCSEDLDDAEAQICPKGPASSPKTCRNARKNGCTMDVNSCYEACSGGEQCEAACASTPGCDPAEACTGENTCFNTCWFGGFGRSCGCEFSWAIYCSLISIDEAAFYGCLYEYPLAEAFGFCTQCEDDPYSCAAP